MNINKNFFLENFKQIIEHFKINDLILRKIIKCAEIFRESSIKNKKIIFIGNGASASISSHVAVDLAKSAKINAINFNEANLITALSNDYGQEKWCQKALEMYYNTGDTVVLISSSGKSKNIINAALWAINSKANLITFTGFNNKNPLKKINKKGINFWVKSRAYNHIELVHLYWLLSIVDYLIGKNVYKVK